MHDDLIAALNLAANWMDNPAIHNRQTARLIRALITDLRAGNLVRREDVAWDSACTIALIVDWLRGCAAVTEAIPALAGVHDAKMAFEYAAKIIESGKFSECGE